MSLYNHKEYLDIQKKNRLVADESARAEEAHFEPMTDLERIEQETDSTHAHDQVRFVRYNAAAHDQLAKVAALRKKDWVKATLKR